MRTTKEQLRESCESIAKDLSNGVEVTEDNLEYFEENGLEVGDMVGASDYLEYEGAMDIEYTITAGMDWRGGRIAVSLGGPNIFINTNNNYVEGNWGGDSVSIPFTDKIGIDDHLEECYNCSR